jgi:hypothetical protein
VNLSCDLLGSARRDEWVDVDVDVTSAGGGSVRARRPSAWGTAWWRWSWRCSSPLDGDVVARAAAASATSSATPGYAWRPIVLIVENPACSASAPRTRTAHLSQRLGTGRILAT